MSTGIWEGSAETDDENFFGRAGGDVGLSGVGPAPAGVIGWLRVGPGAYVRAQAGPLRKKVFGKVRASLRCSPSVPASRGAQRKRFLNLSLAARRGVPSLGGLSRGAASRPCARLRPLTVSWFETGTRCLGSWWWLWLGRAIDRDLPVLRVVTRPLFRGCRRGV